MCWLRGGLKPFHLVLSGPSLLARPWQGKVTRLICFFFKFSLSLAVDLLCTPALLLDLGFQRRAQLVSLFPFLQEQAKGIKEPRIDIRLVCVP